MRFGIGIQAEREAQAQDHEEAHQALHVVFSL